MTALVAENLTYTFAGGVPALKGLSLSIARGRRLAILGPNGAGKSTLFLHLNGTLQPDSGRVLVAGEPGSYSRKGLSDWRRRVALVLQDPDDQLFAATVAEDISFGPLNLGLSDDETRNRVNEALEVLKIGDLRDRATHMLSGGQKKRVAIAGAIAMRPDVLLLDEPTAGLDHAASMHLIALLDRMAEAGMTLVFSTHDVDLALRLADDVALFSDGRVMAEGPAETILSNRALLEEAHLRPPLLTELGLKARALGLLAAEDALPRDIQGFEALMARWQERSEIRS
ncbi:energy-coupling factor ABC transporter ATP-binding protein [Oryzibacter oryziterrae]|uniref:energy-coupling factor ABC transporter ATP-binding protein n=1 Tax=Oryzibacter oryziterrae TaxID=2766474 RepID=UPI001F01B632|nr:ATP-binding cassette domain-containing protein [Oryzibacter oryziterrae]